MLVTANQSALSAPSKVEQLTQSFSETYFHAVRNFFTCIDGEDIVLYLTATFERYVHSTEEVQETQSLITAHSEILCFLTTLERTNADYRLALAMAEKEVANG